MDKNMFSFTLLHSWKTLDMLPWWLLVPFQSWETLNAPEVDLCVCVCWRCVYNWVISLLTKKTWLQTSSKWAMQGVNPGKKARLIYNANTRLDKRLSRLAALLFDCRRSRSCRVSRLGWYYLRRQTPIRSILGDIVSRGALTALSEQTEATCSKNPVREFLLCSLFQILRQVNTG